MTDTRLGLVAALREAQAEVERLRAHLHLAGTARNSEAVLREKAEAALARIRDVCASDWLNIEMPDLWDGRRLVVLVDDILEAIEGENNA